MGSSLSDKRPKLNKQPPTPPPHPPQTPKPSYIMNNSFRLRALLNVYIFYVKWQRCIHDLYPKVHIFDEIVKSQRLTDILFCSCKKRKKNPHPPPAVVLECFHVNLPYANMSLPQFLCRYWPVCHFITKFRVIHYSDPCNKFA